MIGCTYTDAITARTSYYHRTCVAAIPMPLGFTPERFITMAHRYGKAFVGRRGTIEIVVTITGIAPLCANCGYSLGSE